MNLRYRLYEIPVGVSEKVEKVSNINIPANIEFFTFCRPKVSRV